MEDDPNLYIGPPDPLRDHPRYNSLRLLSQGSCGVVLLAYDTVDRDYVAVKLIERSAEKLTKSVEREIINHSLLSHPHVIRFRECFLTTKHLAIVMEYVAGGNLHQLVNAWGGLPEALARWFFQQLIVALDYCHKMSICSRDVKLENTLIDNPADPSKAIIKLCDFGYSINEAHSLPQSAVGTPGYTAPEILTSRCRYDAKLADVWSCGVMLYIMLFCAYPFERPEDARLGPKRQAQANARRIMAADYQLPASKPVSRECCDLLARILVPSPHDRISVPEIQQHPWFQEDLPGGIEGVNARYLGNVEQANAQALTVRTILRGALQAATCPPTFLPGQSHPSPMPLPTPQPPLTPGNALPKPHPRTISSGPSPSQSSSRAPTAGPICPACNPGLVSEPFVSQSHSHSHSTVPRMDPTCHHCSPGLVPELPMTRAHHPCMHLQQGPAGAPQCSQHLFPEPSMSLSHEPRTGPQQHPAGGPHLVAEQQRLGAQCHQGHLRHMGQPELGQGLSSAAMLARQHRGRPGHPPLGSTTPTAQHLANVPFPAASAISSPCLPHAEPGTCCLTWSPAPPTRAISDMTDASHLSRGYPGSHSLPGLTTFPQGSGRARRNVSLPSSTGDFQLPIEPATPSASRPALDVAPDLFPNFSFDGLASNRVLRPGLQEVPSQHLSNAAPNAAYATVGRQHAEAWYGPHSSCRSATPWLPAGEHPLSSSPGVSGKRSQPDRMPASGDWSTSPAAMQQRHSPDSGHLVCRAMPFPRGP